MKKNKNEEENILALGQKQEEIQIEEEKSHKRVLPTILILIGIILVAGGFFYKDIMNFLGIDINKKEEVKDKDNKTDNDNKLICTKNTTDQTLGITTTITYTYTFKNKLLKSLNEQRKISPIEYSDIGPDNIKVISGKYTDVITSFQNIIGLTTSSTLNNDKLTVNINIDYQTLDPTKVVANDRITIVNKLDETSSSVKQKALSDKDTLCS